MGFSPGDLIGNFLNTGENVGHGWPTAPSGSVATDMQVQAGTSAPSLPAMSSASGASNATAGADSRALLHWSAGIVLASLVALWLLGAIVLKVK